MKEAAHDVLVRAGSQVCSVVVFVATVAPGVTPGVEGEAGGGRRPGLVAPQQLALSLNDNALRSDEL